MYIYKYEKVQILLDFATLFLQTSTFTQYSFQIVPKYDKEMR